MPKDIDGIITRLLYNSYLIINEFNFLTALSHQDMENTKDYNEHIENVKKYINTEAVILNNIDLNTLKEIYHILPNYEVKTTEMAYERISINIEDKIEELQYSLDKVDDEDISYEEERYDFDEEKLDDSILTIRKYFLDDEDNEKDELAFVNYINVFVLKRLNDRINNTYTDNKNDLKYKERLLENLRTYKYLVFASSSYLEKYGLNYHFNITKMPYLDCPNMDSNIISYNHCVSVLDKLYNFEPDKEDLDDITICLFNMMCFEAYLNNVDIELYDKLLALCDELQISSKNPYIGNIAKNKILTKTKN